MIQIWFTTLDSLENAETIAQSLVDEKLAACVSLLPQFVSIYRWKQEIHRTPEVLLIIKTAADRGAELKQRLAELHPYEVPEMIALSVADGHVPYLDWVVGETRP